MATQGIGGPAEVALRAALAGGEVVRRAAAEGRATGARLKGVGDYVTEVDLASEAAIKELLSRESPEIPFHGEEGGGSSSGSQWVVDPLDGTTNFLHGFPVVGVSVALIERGRPTAGCVHAPLLGDTFVAGAGAGAWHIGGENTPVRMTVSKTAAPQAIVATGFPFRNVQLRPRYMRMLAACLESFEDLRRAGAAALDLAWVAAGVFDGFFELGLSSWDVAAGGLLIQEAGGAVTDWEGADGWLSGDVLAGPSPIHAKLQELAAATSEGS
jgi:myo-inositol-1(or 4)-monophosphatase